MTVLAVHRTKPNWPADPARPIVEVPYSGASYWVETDGSMPSESDLLAVIAPTPQPNPIVDGADFLARFTDGELKAIDAACAANAQISRWVKLALMRGEVDVGGKTALAAKDGLIKAGIITPDRASIVFAPAGDMKKGNA
jgi:hypothetical protein